MTNYETIAPGRYRAVECMTVDIYDFEGTLIHDGVTCEVDLLNGDLIHRNNGVHERLRYEGDNIWRSMQGNAAVPYRDRD